MAEYATDLTLAIVAKFHGLATIARFQSVTHLAKMAVFAKLLEYVTVLCLLDGMELTALMEFARHHVFMEDVLLLISAIVPDLDTLALSAKLIPTNVYSLPLSATKKLPAQTQLETIPAHALLDTPEVVLLKEDASISMNVKLNV
jgi:hypothetical protein